LSNWETCRLQVLADELKAEGKEAWCVGKPAFMEAAADLGHISSGEKVAFYVSADPEPDVPRIV
jgi:hypothetical protein